MKSRPIIYSTERKVRIMSGYMNKVILLGNLTRDPELRYTQDGTAVASLDIAMNKPARTGEQESKPIFVRITVWKKQAESCAEYLKKGSQVLIDGELKLDSWTDKDGNNRSKIEVTAHNVQFMGGKPKADASPDETPARDEPTEPEPNQDEQ